MQVTFNSEPVSPPDGLVTVGEVVGYVESDLLPSQHVIVRIVKDGQEVSGHSEDGESFTQPAPDCTLEIYSARAVDVAQASLQDAADVLPVLVSELPAAAAELTSGEVEVGLTRFSQCMESISWYVDLIGATEYILSEAGQAGAAPLGPDGEELSMEDAVIGGWPGAVDEVLSFASVENLRQKLLDVQLAQYSNDTVLLANMIQYEILPIVQIWIRELPTLISRVARQGHVA